MPGLMLTNPTFSISGTENHKSIYCSHKYAIKTNQNSPGLVKIQPYLHEIGKIASASTGENNKLTKTDTLQNSRQ